MNSMEQKNQLSERKKRLEEKLAQFFEQLYIRDNLCFRKMDGTVFSLCAFLKDEAIAVEYAECYDEAMLNRFEDGDLFYLAELDEEVMFQKMLREIEQ